MSTAFLTSLVSKTNKRAREKSNEEAPLKKRKVSKHVEEMRKENIDDLYDDAGGGGGRNKIATGDLKKRTEGSDDEDEEIQQIRNKLKVGGNSSKMSTPKPVTTIKKTGADDDLPSFDLTCSPEISPVKKMTYPVKTKPVSPPTRPRTSPKTNLRPAPNYNRKLLLSVPHEALIKAGVLVQVYNYKKDKKLPLKGGLELSAKKGVTVTFFKVGQKYFKSSHYKNISHHLIPKVF